MKIMSINAGSSSLKFSLFNMDTEEVIASGLFERIGIENGHYVIKFNGEKIEQNIDLENHEASVFEKKNSAFFGKGMVFNKYTGSRGKSGSNDASAEFIGKLRKVMDDADVYFQMAELGKVDAGGGGTIAYILANLDMNVIDSGIAVQNMHAPYEVISKADLYETLKGYEAFLQM